MKKIYNIFFVITFLSIIGIIYIQYDKNSFFKNPLPLSITNKLDDKVVKIRKKILQTYNVNVNFPIKVSDKLPANLYGMATMNENNKIVIYLNKKRFKESEEYMYGVLIHEYAHAMMFYFGDFTKVNSGHSKKWQKICYNLGGITCQRFVNRHDILIQKTRF